MEKILQACLHGIWGFKVLCIRRVLSPFRFLKPLVVFNVSLEPVTFTTLKDFRLVAVCIILRRIVVLLYRPGQRFRNEVALAFSPFRAILWPALYHRNIFKF
jgi:hypothetical protein